MKTITQRLMKILLVTLMMIIPLGINNSVVYAEDDSAKELKVGETYYIGETMVVLNVEPAYIQTDSESYPIKIFDSYQDYGAPARFTVPTPQYESEHGWYGFHDMFVNESYDSFPLCLNSEELDESVTGIKCVSGDGTLTNPYAFELVTTTPSTDPTVIDKVTFTITPPVAGIVVSGVGNNQNPYPQVSISDNASYKLGRNEGLPANWINNEDASSFEGIFEAGENYYATVWVRPKEGYKFNKDIEQKDINITNGECKSISKFYDDGEIIYIGIVVKVQCKAAPQTKELKLNEVYYIGDTIEISEDDVWISFVDTDDSNVEAASKGEYVLPEPEFYDDYTPYWVFDTFISMPSGSVWGLFFYNEVSAEKKPVGVKCSKGEGTEANPYRFELLYETPLASKVKAIQLNLDKTASNLIGAQVSSIYFGNYPQSKADSVEGLTEGKHFINVDEWNYLIEPIKWRVLSNEKNSTTKKQELLLLSDMVLDCKPYHSEWIAITWEGSFIRSWLNDGFLKTAFLDDEQNAILTSDVINGDNPVHDTSGGNDTEDKIFLLPIDEVLDIDAALEVENIDKFDEEKYGFTDKASRRAKATDYAISKGVWKNDDNYAYYWLRSPGGYPIYVVFIDRRGDVYPYGHINNDGTVGVRPAFNLDASNILFTSSAEGTKAQSSLGLKGISETATTDWKLTLLDDTRKFVATQTGTTKGTYEAGDTLSFTYEEAKTEDNEYISAIITDDKDNVLYYGRLLQLTDTTDTSEPLNVTLPDNLDDGNYVLHIFNEQYNGGDDDSNLTDYASKFSTTKLTVKKSVTTVSYEIKAVDSSSWTKGSTTTLDFRCVRTPEVEFNEYNTRLTSVVIDKEIELNEDQYDIAPGSIIIKLKPELLEKLPIGSHTITLIFDDGRASANFSVKAKGSGSTPSYSIPKTGVE